MQKIIFVYNANSGKINGLLDSLHKIFSPSTYDCNLCAITYSNFKIKDEWKDFLAEIDTLIEFLHKDEFYKIYPNYKTELPIALIKEDNKLSEFISADKLRKINLQQLKEILRNYKTHHV
ncbi:MAG: hypothetical protein H7Y00_08465 [Fimbriimonadaceae bacterium]|nr:hypothetical protein [Chitinophagales bacterium]